jgi:hypothetical protein
VNVCLWTSGCLNQSLWNLVCSHDTWAHSAACFINPSHQFVSLYVCPSYRCYARAHWSIVLISFLGNGSVNIYQQKRRIIAVVFSAVRVESKECRWLVLPRTSCYFSLFTPFLSYSVTLSLPLSFPMSLFYSSFSCNLFKLPAISPVMRNSASYSTAYSDSWFVRSSSVSKCDGCRWTTRSITENGVGPSHTNEYSSWQYFVYKRILEMHLNVPH